MGDIKIENVLGTIISSITKFLKKEKPTKSPNEKPHKNIEDREKKRMELKDQLVKVKGDIVELIKAGDHELKDHIDNVLKGLISERSENQSSGHEVIKEISSVSDVVDLSVTGLTEKDLKSFWDTVKNFKNLTSLGVGMSVTEPSAFTLPDHCGDNLKEKLKRLRMEGKFPISSTSDQPYSGLNKLRQFKSLIDLTLASPEPININSIPTLKNLLCLRLYGVCNEKIFEIGAQQFESLKKLVIGDMKDVETVEIGGGVIKTLATLELCKLPKLKKLVCLTSSSDEKQTILKWGRKGCSRKNQSPKTIYLRDFDNIPNDKSPGLTIYNYEMNKQRYEEVKYNP